MFDSCGFSFCRPHADSMRIYETGNAPHDVHSIQQSFHSGAKLCHNFIFAFHH